MLPNSFDERFSLNEVSKNLRVHIATVWRWTLSGVKGRKLRTVLVGGRRFVLQSDLAKFLAPEEPHSPAPDRDRRADIAGRLLDAQGVRAKAVPKSCSPKQAS